MKSAVSLALSMCLVSSAFPVAAQDGIAATPGPIARAITREAVRLGTVQEVGKPGGPDWARVRRLVPGTEVIVTVRGSQPGKRHVVSASDSVLTVLNLTDPSLPDAATRALLSMAANHSEYFAGAQAGRNFVFDKSVRIASDGVFVADQKVADLGQVVETIARTDVVEVRPGSASVSGVRKGALIGALIGAAGGIAIALANVSQQCEGGCATPGKAFLVYGGVFGGVGTGIGAGVGAIIGASTHHSPDAIYRAP